MVAIGCWIGLLFGPNAMIAAVNANYLALLPDAFGVSRTALTSVMAIALWTVALCVPLFGRAMDKYGVRTIILPGLTMFGLLMACLGLAQNLWQFAILQVLFSIAVSTHVAVGYAKVIASWFDRSRGLVLGLCVAMGAGVGQTIMPKLSQWYIAEYTWRGGYFIQGAMALFICLPLVALLVRTPPAVVTVAGEPEVVPVEISGLTRGEALRKPTFYLLFFAILFASMALLGSLQHSVAILTERGFSLSSATTVLSLSFMGVIAGEFSSGFLVDRFNSPRIVLPYFISALIGVLIVHSTHSAALLPIGGLLLGLGLGGEIGQNAYLVSRYFGLKSFGGIYGLTFAGSSIGNGGGLILLGMIRDRTGSYSAGFYLAGGAMLISVLCIAALGPFVYAGKRHGKASEEAAPA